MIRPHALMFSALYSTSYIATILIGIFFNPAPLANIFGLLALLCYIATLLPSLLKAVFPTIKGNKTLMWLLKYRRHLGVAGFCLGANHGVLLIIERHLNLLDWHTYIHSFSGMSTLAIFTVLAVTSNDESVKHLKKLEETASVDLSSYLYPTLAHPRQNVRSLDFFDTIDCAADNIHLDIVHQKKVVGNKNKAQSATSQVAGGSNY